MITIEVNATDSKGNVTDISKYVGDVGLSGAIKESTRTLSFKALRADVDKSFEAYNLNLGDRLVCKEIFEEGGEKKFFEGVVWSKATKDNDVAIDVTCYDKAIYLNKNEPSVQVYTDKTAKEAGEAIISELGLEVGKLADTGKYNFNLRGLTGYDAIMACYTKDSEATGKKYKLVDIDGVINVFESGEKHPVVLEELDEPVVGKLLDTSYKESLDELVNEVKAIEDKKKDKKEDVEEDPESQERFGKIQKVLKGDASELAGLMQDAKQEIEVTCIGDWDMVAGKSIELKSSIVSGTYYIISDSHKLDDGVHTVDLKLSNELEMDTKNEGKEEGNGEHS